MSKGVRGHRQGEGDGDAGDCRSVIVCCVATNEAMAWASCLRVVMARFDGEDEDEDGAYSPSLLSRPLVLSVRSVVVVSGCCAREGGRGQGQGRDVLTAIVASLSRHQLASSARHRAGLLREGGGR